MSDPAPDLPTALARAVARVRLAAGAPAGTVLVLVPGEANGVLARQSLADAGPWIRVETWTPAAVIRDLAATGLAGRRPEPVGWRRATLGVLVRQLAARGDLGAHGATLARPGWRDAIAEAIDVLEAAGLDAAALRAHPPADASLAERADLLASLLDALDARRRDEGLHGPGDLADAARRALDEDRPAPVRRAVGAVILGDLRLPRAVHAVLVRFLAPLPVVRVDLPPLDALDPEPTGLVAAAPHAEPIRVAPAPGALGGLQARLFRQPAGTALDPDRSLALARAPDDLREVREAARFVQDAVLAGTPLDRVAVALPTGERADAWWAELERAGLPATWLVGPPLSREPAARVLRLVADLAAGDGTPRRWYELLRQPGLRLRARLGPEGTAGRGRWRRLLAGCATARGATALGEALGTPDPDDAAAVASLRLALAALDAELGALDEPAPLGVHAGRLAGFLRRWWARSRDREQVLQLLEGWAAARSGFPFGLDEAAAELAEAFDETPALSGSLTEPRLRVLSPAALLGGAFDVVVMPGLAHGRFPAEPRDHPLLPDALRTHLEAALGVEVPRAADVRERDRRKFATAVAGCRGRLVLLWHETDLDGRPRLPGEWALAAASAVRGRRAGYRDAEALSSRVGSRARPHVDDPERALGAVEFLLARAARDREAAVRWLAAEPTTRRLLALQRSPRRLALEGIRDAWSGQVPPALLACPGLDGGPLRPGALAGLLRDPGRFFFRDVLGAWPVRALPDGFDLLDALGDRLVRAIEAALDAPGPLDPAVWAAWAEDLAGLEVEPADREAADALFGARWWESRDLAARARGPRVEVPPTRLFDGLPWVVEGEVGRHVGRAIVAFGDRAWPFHPSSGANTLIAAVAAANAGRLVDTAVNVGLDKALEAGLAEVRPALEATLTLARDLAAAGAWPWGPKSTFRLADEPQEALE